MAEIKSLKDHPRPFVSVKEAADFLEVSEKHIQRAIDKGSLQARKYGRVIRILITDFQDWAGSTERNQTGIDRKF